MPPVRRRRPRTTASTTRRFNRGTRSLTLNLRAPEGRALLAPPRRRASTPSTTTCAATCPAKLGLDYAALAHVNPRIVCCSLSGFGRTGPRARRARLRLPAAGVRRLHERHRRARRAADASAASRSSTSPAACCRRSALMIGLHRARATGRRLRRRRVAARHRGLDAQLPGRLDAQPRLAARSASPTARTRASCRARASATARRLARRHVHEGEVLAAARRAARAARRCADDPRFRTFADRLAHRDALVADARGRVPRAARPPSGSSGCAATCRWRRSTPSTRRSPTSRCWRARWWSRSSTRVFGTLREVGCPIKIDGVAPRYAPGAPLGADTAALLREWWASSAAEIERAARRAGDRCERGAAAPESVRRPCRA